MRRGLDRGRLLIGVGAILSLIAMPLPWYTVGGEVLPAVSGNGFEGAGILVFLSAVGLLAVLALPYASRTGRSSLDRPAVYLALVALGIAGLVIVAIGALDLGRLGLPDRALGLWLAAAGMAIAGWGAAEVATARRETA